MITMSANVKRITTAELVSKQWYVDLAWKPNEILSEYRERFNNLNWDELLECIGVELIDDECVEISDADYDALFFQYTITFQRC